MMVRSYLQARPSPTRSNACNFVCVRSPTAETPRKQQQQQEACGVLVFSKDEHGPQPRQHGHAVHSSTLCLEICQTKRCAVLLLRGKVAVHGLP